MGLASKTVTIASALAGLAAFSQAPEFAQQYRQRIGGAVAELKVVVADFDKDAQASQLSREKALQQMQQSAEQFSRDRGQSIGRTIGRYDRLSTQQGWLENAHPFLRPFQVARNPDSKILNEAWEIFEPAVPLTAAGAIFGGIGALLAFILARLGIGAGRRMRRNKRDTKLANAIEDNELQEGAVKLTEKNAELPVAKDEPIARRGIPVAMAVSPAARSAASYYKMRVNEFADETREPEDNQPRDHNLRDGTS